jgi:hypothetical protein
VKRDSGARARLRALGPVMSGLLWIGATACNADQDDVLETEEDAGPDDEERADGGHADAAIVDAGDEPGDDAATAPPPVLSNVLPAQVPDAPAFDLAIGEQCEFDSEEGTFECPGLEDHDGEFAFRVVNLDDGSRYGVISVRSLQVDMQGVISVRGDLPLVIVAQKTLRVFGRISVASDAAVAYAGGFAPNPTGDVGHGPGAGERGQLGQFRPSSGGSYCGVGGRGASPEEETPGAAGGATYGNARLTPLVGGSSGGGPYGGAGGGALQLVAGDEIQIGPFGVVDAGGGGGGNTSSGAGSGGALLLESKRVRVQGILAANGGGGGAAQGGSPGQDGRPDAVPAASEIPSLGGQGSAADEPNGADGTFMTQNQALGGGGGAGRIRINTEDGSAEISGTLSPSEATDCATLGML